MRIGEALRNAPVPPAHVVALVVGVLLDRFHPVRLPGPRAVQILSGLALASTGSVLAALAVRVRRQHTVGEFDLARPQSLVTDGPYRVSRHPMYVGWWLIHLGFGICRGSAWVFATLPPAALAEHHAALLEEEMLAREFGTEFDGYARRVPRYLGWRPIPPRGA